MSSNHQEISMEMDRPIKEMSMQHLIQPMIQDWADEFNPDLQVAINPEFEKIYQQKQWEMEFQSMQRTNEFESVYMQSVEFEQAENMVNSNDWAQEFKENNKDWTEEFTAEQALEDGGDISITAGKLLDAVSSCTNPKFKNSKFLGLMQQFKNKTAAIEGDKVVQQITAVSNCETTQRLEDPITWAQEFSGRKIKHVTWEEEFQMDSPFSANRETGVVNWASEFEDMQNSISRDPQLDWASKFNDNILDPDAQEDKRLYEQDWVETFQDKMQITPQDQSSSQTWDNTWENAVGFENLDPRYKSYEFVRNNPYHAYGMEFLRDPGQHRNLTESILALEAAVQKEPSSTLWKELGKKHQDNENDAMAIAALQKAVELDPSSLEALLYLSVSFTNERHYNEAYDSLHKWIQRHPKYHVFAPGAISNLLSEKHDQISASFMEAAISNPELDHEVQICLGILFNISADYSKAVDCFEAALSKTPSDYQLWNKLGATLANSQDPHKAMDAYFNAIQINPNYIRARFNLAIACIQIGEYKEAAEHLLQALSIQEQELDSKGESLWSTLRIVLDVHLQRPDLVMACDEKNLNAFKEHFDFFYATIRNNKSD